MKIFLTGATGYVGHQLALQLAANGCKVHIMVRDIHSPNIPQHDNIVVYSGDITNRASVSTAMKGCEQVYHTAAVVKLFARDPSQFYKVNVTGTQNLLDEAIALGVKKFVYTSTCGVLGSSLNCAKKENDPRTESFYNEYDFTKYLGENLVKEYSKKGLFTVIVALSKVFGPGIETHPVSVNKVIHNFIRGKLLFVPGQGTTVTNYCFIKDIIEGHLLAMQHGLGGEKYILGGYNLSYNSLFTQIKALSKSRAVVIRLPRYFITLLAFVNWCTYKITKKEPYVTLKGIRHIFTNKEFDNSKAVRQLHYQPTPFAEALTQTIQFLKSRQHA